MTLTYKDYTMPCVGITFNGQPLYKQPNGRITTKRCINTNGQDLVPFTTIDVLNTSVISLPKDWVGVDFPTEDTFAMINTTEGLLPIIIGDTHRCLVKTYSPTLVEDREYGTSSAPYVDIEQVSYIKDTGEIVYIDEGHLLVISERDDLDIESIVEQFNAIQEERVSSYLFYAIIEEDMYLNPIFYN